MEGPSLPAACCIAFGAVFVVLALLALLIQLISLAFPERASRADPALIVAIAGSVASLYRGARVRMIAEEP